MTTCSPQVDVILCTANRDSAGLAQTLDSLQHSTLREIRVVLVNDSPCSLPAGLFPPGLEIHVLNLGVNQGLTKALKAAESCLVAPLVARMDCGDTMDPRRLALQRAFLLTNEDCVLLGTKSSLLASDGVTQGNLGSSASSDEIQDMHRHLLWRNPFVHGSIMFRRVDFLAVGGYDASCAIAQDFNLYMRMRQRGRLYILPDLLYTHRFNLANSSTVNKNKMSRASSLRSRCALMSFGEFFSPVFIAGALRDAMLLLLPSGLSRWLHFNRRMQNHEHALD